MCLGEQGSMAQVLGPLSPAWETQTSSWLWPGRPRLLQTFGERTGRLKLCAGALVMGLEHKGPLRVPVQVSQTLILSPHTSAPAPFSTTYTSTKARFHVSLMSFLKLHTDHTPEGLTDSRQNPAVSPMEGRGCESMCSSVRRAGPAGPPRGSARAVTTAAGAP